MGLEWLAPQGCVATPSLFQDGDLIALEIADAVAHRVLLLAPGQWTHSVFDVQRSEAWSAFLNDVRGFFIERHFIEAQTPTLVPSPGTEPYLDPFSTEWTIGSAHRTLYLPTSPEFHLKRLLALGWTRIFEVKTCFRNGEIGDHHQPEFQMLEWYRAYSNLDVIGDDVDHLLQALSAKFGRAVPRLKRTTIADLFEKAFEGFNLTPHTSRDDLALLAGKNKIDVSANDSFDDLFFRLFLEKIEASLGTDGPLLVSHYPPSQAALSRIGVHGWAERFEVYWNGLELANAFHELNDPIENEARFRQDAETKMKLGKHAVPRDENLMRAIEAGMPPAGGIALGIDRLFMAFFEIAKIEETRAFPLRPFILRD